MNKKFITSVLILIFTVTGALAYFKYFSGPPMPKLPDPKEQKPDEIAKVIASDTFTKLPQKAKDAYLENLVNQDKTREIFYSARDMSDEDRKNLRDNMRAAFEITMKKTAQEYYALPPEKKEAYLDAQLDKMAERFAERQRQMEAQGGTGGGGGGSGGSFFGGRGQDSGGGGAQAGQGQGQGGRRREAPSPQQVKNRIENTDPESRAQMSQYRAALRKRAQQRSNN